MNDTIIQYPVNIYNKEDKPYEVWETIIIPLIIGPLVLLIKIMYDRWKKSSILKHQIITDKIKQKLEVFYWPLYLLLMKEYDFLIHFTKDNTDELNYHSESEIEDNPDDLQQCIYEFVDRNQITHKCKNYVSVNTITKHGAYCIKHYNFRKRKIIRTIELDDSAVAININNRDVEYQQELVNQNQLGLVMLKIIEIIGEDDISNLDSETIYFLNKILNELNLKKIRNNILSKALPVRA